MAKEIFYKVVSDLSKDVLEEGDVQTVQLGWKGSTYELDLSNAEASELTELIETYTKAGRKVTRSARNATGTSAPKSNREELQAIREWAKGNGYDVSERGRIKQEVQDAYRSAN
ncbi:hypothetical protein B5P43_18515 [Bacillus sp. SRB_336]|nr:hypothetical protein B5P43_18515 [Bacillus sp. SRB_336]